MAGWSVQTKNVFVSHVHEDEAGLADLRNRFRRSSVRIGKTGWLVLLLTVSLVPRLAFAYWNRDGLVADLPRFLTVAETVQAGESALSLPPFRYHGYPPPWVWFETLALNITQATGLPFAFTIKVPTIIADALIAVSIFLLTGSGAWALVYGLKPDRRAAGILVVCLTNGLTLPGRGIPSAGVAPRSNTRQYVEEGQRRGWVWCGRDD